MKDIWDSLRNDPRIVESLNRLPPNPNDARKLLASVNGIEEQLDQFYAPGQVLWPDSAKYKYYLDLFQIDLLEFSDRRLVLSSRTRKKQKTVDFNFTDTPKAFHFNERGFISEHALMEPFPHYTDFVKKTHILKSPEVPVGLSPVVTVQTRHHQGGNGAEISLGTLEEPTLARVNFDPNGNFAGAAFRIDDLSGYNEKLHNQRRDYALLTDGLYPMPLPQGNLYLVCLPRTDANVLAYYMNARYIPLLRDANNNDPQISRGESDKILGEEGVVTSVLTFGDATDSLMTVPPTHNLVYKFAEKKAFNPDVQLVIPKKINIDSTIAEIGRSNASVESVLASMYAPLEMMVNEANLYLSVK